MPRNLYINLLDKYIYKFTKFAYLKSFRLFTKHRPIVTFNKYERLLFLKYVCMSVQNWGLINVTIYWTATFL